MIPQTSPFDSALKNGRNGRTTGAASASRDRYDLYKVKEFFREEDSVLANIFINI
jgi:hypothetical protein